MDTAPRLGVDIGRVIIDGSAHPGGGDTAFFHGGVENALRTPPMAGVFDVLPRLVEHFDGRAWLISKCGERVQARTLAWLDHHDFHDRTGIPPDHVRFCRARPEKADHCRELGITDFVDDRVDVHEAVRGVVERGYLFGPQRGPHPSWLPWAPDWAALEGLVVRRGRGGPASPARRDPVGRSASVGTRAHGEQRTPSAPS